MLEKYLFKAGKTPSLKRMKQNRVDDKEKGLKGLKEEEKTPDDELDSMFSPLSFFFLYTARETLETSPFKPR